MTIDCTGIRKEQTFDMKPEQLLTDETFLGWYFRTDDDAIKKWERLMHEEPHLKANVDEAVSLLKLMQTEDETTVDEQQIAQASTKLMARVQDWEDAKPSRHSLKNIVLRWTMPVAASLLMALGVVWYVNKDSTSKVYVASEKMLELKLADGSLVKLNKGSELKVTGMEHEAAGSREVWLKGEAFFDVSHLPNHRGFVVHSGEVDVAVLGTRFNVRSFSNSTSVALESGKVELSINKVNSQKLLMQPGDLVEYSNSSGNLVKREVNVQNYTAWQSGKVIFENATLLEIQKVLEERFGLKVQVEQGSELGEFNGVFPADDPAVLINALTKAYPHQVVRIEGGVQFKKSVND